MYCRRNLSMVRMPNASEQVEWVSLYGPGTAPDLFQSLVVK